MTRILAVSDEVEEHLCGAGLKTMELDLIAACGDLPFDYLETLVSLANVPLLYVPGNHDPELRRAAQAISPEDVIKPLTYRRDELDPPGPLGCVNLDGRVTEVAGLRIAGLGGSMRYTKGPNQYTQGQMQFRAAKLELKTYVHSLVRRDRLDDHRDVRPRSDPPRRVDVILTHAPPFGLGDGDDTCHEGFSAFHGLVGRLAPKVLIHGHIHPYGQPVAELRMDKTRVINAVGHRVVEL